LAAPGGGKNQAITTNNFITRKRRITMPVYEEEPVVERRVVRDTGDDNMASYAFVKYAFILAITIVILYFIARVLLPAFGG
jgi:hypothetical protein